MSRLDEMVRSHRDKNYNFTVGELERLNVDFQDKLREVWTLTASEVGRVVNVVLRRRNLLALYHFM